MEQIQVAKRKKKVSTKRKIDAYISKNCKRILEGNVLVIDPASGAGSDPGYAEIVKGVIVDSGIIEVPRARATHKRLRLIKECLDAEFKERKYDLLVLEGLSIFQFRRMRSASILIESCGVFLACIESDEVMYVNPRTWRAYANATYGENGWEKSDEGDARMMAELVISLSKEVIDATS